MMRIGDIAFVAPQRKENDISWNDMPKPKTAITAVTTRVMRLLRSPGCLNTAISSISNTIGIRDKRISMMFCFYKHRGTETRR